MNQSFILLFLKHPNTVSLFMDMKCSTYFFHVYVDTCITLVTTSYFKNVCKTLYFKKKETKSVFCHNLSFSLGKKKATTEIYLRTQVHSSIEMLTRSECCSVNACLSTALRYSSIYKIHSQYCRTV